jgi:hypothetical protein
MASDDVLFLFWPPHVWTKVPTPIGIRLLRLSATIVVATSLTLGTAAFVKDLRVAFWQSWPRIVPPPVQTQIGIAEREMGDEAALLVTYAGTDSWYARMWQRVLYPRTVIILPSSALKVRDMARLRIRYRLQYALTMGSPPADPGFVRTQDLGNVPGSQDRAWFGELSR